MMLAQCFRDWSASETIQHPKKIFHRIKYLKIKYLRLNAHKTVKGADYAKSKNP